MLHPRSKPKEKAQIKWTADFAYAVGLIASDGCLSKYKKTITLVSKDREQIINFRNCLQVKNKIGRHSSGSTTRKYYRVQIPNIQLHTFLTTIGITPAKSKTIGKVDVPEEFFFDFLRGSFDGDGYTHSYFDKRWRSSFMAYIGFCSASPEHLYWLRHEISKRVGIKGHITSAVGSSCLQLKYAKTEMIPLLREIYKNTDCIHLSRKRLKINEMLAIVGVPSV